MHVTKVKICVRGFEGSGLALCPVGLLMRGIRLQCEILNAGHPAAMRESVSRSLRTTSLEKSAEDLDMWFVPTSTSLPSGSP